ncbi:TonB-dependent receptor [Dokdonia sp. Hel_I_53]|uniref:TonB-dependent receptor n=1 Tax=Dokdonia sp. Hel_I_53 TaxID=1566287 RepID=UPI00119B1B0A|nr:TonB-dependent receptor [Dokdonia sp. Hel_I_53]TVZ51050.1 iron complex outermembrane receptor protein [Dokdonia sp. Hel_I_53]
MKFKICLCLFVLGTTTVFAQNCTYTLSGYIIDLHDNTVLENATVIVAGSEESATTNAEGKYMISGLCKATYNLQVSHPECETQAVKVAVNGNTTRNINMEHHLETLGGVELIAHAHKSKSKTATEQVISHDVLQANSAASLGDALSQLSGISSLNTGNTVVKPVIQGLHSSRVVMITSGTRLEDQEWGVEHAPNIDVNAAGEVTVIKGAAGLQYGGDAVGGTIIIEPETIPVKDTLYGRILLTGASNGRGGSLATALTKSFNNGWYASVNSSVKRFGDFEAPDYVLSNTAASEENFAARIGFNKYRFGLEGSYSIFDKTSGILRSSHLGGAEDLVIAINREEPFVVRDFTYNINSPYQDVKHQIAKVNGFYRFESFGKLKAQYDYQRNDRLEFDVRRDSDDTRPSIDLQLETVSAQVDFEYTADNTVTAKVGISGSYAKHFPNPNTGVRRLIPDYQAQDFGMYLLGSKQFDNLTIEGGVRLDYNRILAEKFYTKSLWEERGYDIDFTEFERQEIGEQIFTKPDFTYLNFSGTLGGAYELNDKDNIAINYAIASRSPNISELFSDGLHQSAARIEIGDLRFDKEVAHKFSINFTHDTDNWTFTVAPFANFIEDFILIEPTAVQRTIRGSFQVGTYRQTQARLLGFDIDNRIQLRDNLMITNQFSLVKGKDISLDRPLIDIPAASTRNAISYEIPKANNLKIKLESNYVFRQNEFPNNNFQVFLPQTETFEIVDVSTPPDGYHLLNFRGDIDLKLTEKSTLNLGLMVNNIFNTSYREYLNRQRYYADDIGRNILLQIRFDF